MKNWSCSLCKNPFLKKDLDTENIFISEVSFGKNNFKYFIGYEDYGKKQSDYV